MFLAPGHVVLARRVVPQPTPELVAGGDCGACVLGGALGISIERVYDELLGSRQSLSFYEMQRALRVVTGTLADRSIEDPAEWPSSFRGHRSFGRPGYAESLPWFRYVQMAVDAGYYGIAMVDMDRNAGANGGCNHWVMICGARTEGAQNGKTITGDVLVSCSARRTAGADEWVEARDFLKNRGGYDVLFVRPST